MNLQAEHVHAWLSAHPDFFVDHPELLTDLTVPHADTGQAVSLVERQVQGLRERNRALETRLAELIQIARDNDALSAKVQTFAVRLMQQRSTEGAIDAILDGLREGFRVPHVAMRVWGTGIGRANAPERLPTQQEIQVFATGLTSPLCGNHPVYEVNRWFGEHGPRLRSFALAPLGSPAFGLLVLASEEAERFYPDMGTVYLAQLAALAGAALEAHAAGQD